MAHRRELADSFFDKTDLVDRGDITRRRLVAPELASIDPSTEDPEAWQCECLEEFLSICSGWNEDCIRLLMCNSQYIARSWKSDPDHMHGACRSIAIA